MPAMSDTDSPSNPRQQTGHNLGEVSVSELAQAIKRTLEGSFDRVRVRGEISGFKRATSGHLYLMLKDENAAIKAVCWRTTALRLGMAPEDGMEVIVTGRLTSYAERSEYQLVIERIELAGVGALLKMIEERRKKLAAEGLFEPSRKRKLPVLPAVIGVVTSPTVRSSATSCTGSRIASRAGSWSGRSWYRARMRRARSPPPSAASMHSLPMARCRGLIC
jgi:exodeoxyribonuclease VII large subunit